MPPVRPLLAALACGAALIAAAPARATDAPAGCAGRDVPDLAPADADAAISCLVNAVRSDAGLGTLRDNQALAGIARTRSRLLLACDSFTHDPCRHGLTQDAVPYAAGAARWHVGENLQWRDGAKTTPAQVVARWLASPGHRRNVLAPDWQDQGVGVVRDARFQGHEHVWVWVHWFGARTR